MTPPTSGSQMSLSSVMSKSASAMPGVSYSGDKPNPDLRAFVEQHLKDRPFVAATDNYDVLAFNKPLVVEKRKSPLMDLHIYWSKKPHDAIRQYIRHYTSPGDLVLDPFCGSGGTALAALTEGRKAIAIDRSPAATFITKSYCTPVDSDDLSHAFEQVKAKVKAEIDWLYETRCDRCGGAATTAYTVYSEVFQCPRCLEKVPLFDCVEVDGETAAGKPKRVAACPHCHKKGRDEEVSTRSERCGSVPVLVSYLCRNGCKPQRAERRHNDPDRKKRDYFRKYDLAKIKEIEGRTITHWFPPHRMMNCESDTASWGDKWRAGSSSFRTVAELFTKRNLWALAAIKAACIETSQADLLQFLVNTSTLTVSKMCRHDWPSIMAGTYYVPPINRELHVWENCMGRIERKGEDIASQQLDCGMLRVSTQSATDLDGIASNSVDYVFTDPPYAEKVQYGELNFVWEAWLGLDTTWHHDEIIVNDTRGKTEADWTALMKLAMAEAYRVLKPGRWISLCYHDTSEGTWALLQDLMAEVGFIPEQSDSALYIDTGQKSFNQLNADKVNKRDLVINFRKPKPGEFRIARLVIPEDADTQTFRDLAKQVIRDHILANPGCTKDRIFDELVSRMVRSGQMQAHNFDELLREVADEAFAQSGGSSRWYLKEIEESQIDASEQQAEDDAALVMGDFIEKTADKMGDEGVHYTFLFEHYLYAVIEKPRRPLADWLPDYFFKTEDGTWRLPASDEERELKEKARATGIGRRIKRFANMLAAGVSIPAAKIPSSPTLCEWIRHAKRAGLYDAGKLLYERGGLDTDKLSEEQQVEVEEDYQTCVRALQRAAGGEVDKAPKKKRGKKKAD